MLTAQIERQVSRQGSLPALDGPRRAGAREHADDLSGPAFRYLQAGETSVDVRRFAAQRPTHLTPTAGVVHLVIPTAGRMAAAEAGLRDEIIPGAALLLARHEKTRCIWSDDGVGLIVHLPRARIQAEATAVVGEPCRLGGVTAVLRCGDADPLGKAVAALLHRGAAATEMTRSEGVALQRVIIAALVKSLRTAHDDRDVFPVAGSVKRAADHIRAYPQTRYAAEDLAAIAGVTIATLRRNFKACMGVSISLFTQQARLDWVRERLGGATESRSIGQLALDAGFGSPGILARAYQRRFSETASQTRARAFGTTRD